jgi:hypothetical protein
MTWTRSRAELLHMLKQQREALIASCKSYDEGNRWEALRIATAVYIIVHDGRGRSKSILTQLGLRGSLRFVGSGIPCIPGNLAPEAVLAQMRIWKDGKTEYVPWLDKKAAPLRSLQFHEWWENEPVYRDADLSLTRRGLVFSLRNQEGGAHVDAGLTDPSYIRMTRLPVVKLAGDCFRIDLFLHQQGLDTTTPAGKAMFQVLGVIAEFEWAMIAERVRAGLARARSEGKRPGRPPIAPALEKRIQALEARANTRRFRKPLSTQLFAYHVS